MSDDIPSITLTVSALHALVDPVIPHAAGVGDVSILASVFLRVEGRTALAMASDRYRAGMQRVELDEQPVGGAFEAAVPTATLKEIFRAFRGGRDVDPLLTLSATPALLTVAATGGLGGLAEARVTYNLPVPPDQYPQIDRLFRKALTARTEEAPIGAAFNPAFLASFRTGQPRGAVLRITSAGDGNRPWIVRVGDDFLGLLIPVRHDPSTIAPSPDEWLPLLREEKSAKAVAA